MTSAIELTRPDLFETTSAARRMRPELGHLRAPLAGDSDGEVTRHRVLIADDEPIIRVGLSRVLGQMGLEVVEAWDGPSALTAAQTLAPDLVLLDAAMPGYDGYEVCRRLKSDRRTALVPVVLVTGGDSVEDRVLGAEVGADDFFAKPFDVSELAARVRAALRQKSLTDGLEASEAVLFTLARVVEARDADTEGHCSRLSSIAERLGERLEMPLRDRVALRRAGIVHDIGKVIVPDAVLLKRGPLTDGEWVVMRSHAAAGERICAPLRSFRDVLPIIRHHHERLDGSGYPDGLEGDAIPMTARVLQVADVFDALTMARPYKKAQTAAHALGVMEHEVRGGWWDPTVFEAFRRMIREEMANGTHTAC